METGLWMATIAGTAALVLFFMGQAVALRWRALAEIASSTEKAPSRSPAARGLNFAWTGGTLAVLGAAAALTGRTMGYGETAVGLYGGGWACIALGAALLLFAAALRLLDT
jgi:hypothetical protein